jgi:predicted RNA-binding Zn-ribbon protein involved in translation (DUF1610 family)
MPLHEARCARAKRCGACRRLLSPGEEARHFHCPTPAAGCATEVFPTADAAARHAEVYHGAFPCEDCGAEGMTRGAVYEGHLAGACPRRLVACAYCAQKKFREAALEEHERICGAKTDACRACKNLVKRREREVHNRSACALPAAQKPRAGSGGGGGGGGYGDGGFADCPFEMRELLAQMAALDAGGGGGTPPPPPPPVFLGQPQRRLEEPQADDGDVAAVVESGLDMGYAWEVDAVAAALLHPNIVGRADRVKRAIEWLINSS